jgi:hypothetical protein
VPNGSRRFLLFDSRRAVRLLEPTIQLRLPAYLILAGLVLAAALGWAGHVAYQRLLEVALAEAPAAFRETLAQQTSDFAVVSGAILCAYILVLVGISLAFTHRLISPRVALLRQIEHLKNGDYSARVNLREGDSHFRELARDLNDLAQILERAEKAAQQRPAQPFSAQVRR